MNCQSGRKQILAPSHNAPRLNLLKNMLSYMNMQTTSGVAARDHARKIVARKIAAAEIVGSYQWIHVWLRRSVLLDSWVAPSFCLAGLGGAEGRTMIYEVSKDPSL